MEKRIASDYIRSNFLPEDRLAVVLIKKTASSVTQRLSRAEDIASDQYQRWLRYMNKEKHEVYVSMNALHPDAHGRTKAEVSEVRHVYLDFDHKGDEAVKNLLKREDLPEPNHLIESSPDKWQVIWRVRDFGKGQAEVLMRGLVNELGADPAATDVSRVLRVPAYYNHKYAKPHFIRVRNISDEVYTPDRFPEFSEERQSRLELHRNGNRSGSACRNGNGAITQSERDWAYERRALARGDDPQQVVTAIASYRPDKPNPQYYAEHTVQKARVSLESDNAAPDR